MGWVGYVCPSQLQAQHAPKAERCDVVSDCVASAGLLALCPRTICNSSAASPRTCQTHCGEAWLTYLSLKPKNHEAKQFAAAPICTPQNLHSSAKSTDIPPPAAQSETHISTLSVRENNSVKETTATSFCCCCCYYHYHYSTTTVNTTAITVRVIVWYAPSLHPAVLHKARPSASALKAMMIRRGCKARPG